MSSLSLPRIGNVIAVGSCVALLAVVVGVIAASGILLLQLLAAGTITGILLLVLPLTPLMLFLFVITFVVQGLLTYFAGISQAAWLPYMLSILVGLKVVSISLTGKPTVEDAKVWASWPILCLALYFLCLAFASVLNSPGLGQLVAGLKNALPLWLVALLIYQGARDQAFRDSVWRLMIIVFLLQLPFVLYQRIFVVARRQDLTGASGADSLVGTFGGVQNGGGYGSTLVIFALMVMAYFLASWARGRTRLAWVIGVWVVGLTVIMSGEVKAAFIWLPMVFVYALRHQLLSSLGRLAIGLLVGGMVIGGMAMIYKTLYWEGQTGNNQYRTIGELLNYVYDPRNVDYRTGEIGRAASIVLWTADARADIPHRLVGYGAGASRISATGGLGSVAKRFAPLDVTTTGMATMLWDVGAIGFLAFCGVIGSTFLLLRRLAKHRDLPSIEGARLDALAILMLMFASLLIYNRSLVDEPVVQTLLALALGYALRWRILLRGPSTQLRAPVRA
jgi:hypothetical protein